MQTIMQVQNYFESLIKGSNEYVATNTVVKGFLANFFPIAYANIIYFMLGALGIVPANPLNVNIPFLLWLSLFVIFVYAAHAQTIYATKNEMHSGMLSNFINGVVGAAGFGFLFPIIF